MSVSREDEPVAGLFPTTFDYCLIIVCPVLRLRAPPSSRFLQRLITLPTSSSEPATQSRRSGEPHRAVSVDNDFFLAIHIIIKQLSRMIFEGRCPSSSPPLLWKAKYLLRYPHLTLDAALHSSKSFMCLLRHVTARMHGAMPCFPPWDEYHPVLCHG